MTKLKSMANNGKIIIVTKPILPGYSPNIIEHFKKISPYKSQQAARAELSGDESLEFDEYCKEADQLTKVLNDLFRHAMPIFKGCIIQVNGVMYSLVNLHILKEKDTNYIEVRVLVSLL